jgi:ketosteroid isomerase-like protein
MSEENVEIVRRAFAFEFDGRGGPDDAVAIFAPDFVMNPLEGGRRTVWARFETTLTVGRAPGKSST